MDNAPKKISNYIRVLQLLLEDSSSILDIPQGVVSQNLATASTLTPATQANAGPEVPKSGHKRKRTTSSSAEQAPKPRFQNNLPRLEP